jgi:hypothetical protein
MNSDNVVDGRAMASICSPNEEVKEEERAADEVERLRVLDSMEGQYDVDHQHRSV